MNRLPLYPKPASVFGGVLAMIAFVLIWLILSALSLAATVFIIVWVLQRMGVL